MYPPPRRLNYKKALAQQEPGGHTWRVVDHMTKLPDGRLIYSIYQEHIPNKPRAVRLAKIITCAARQL